MQTKPVRVELSVEVNEEVMMAHLLFLNETPQKIYLDKQTIFFGSEVRNNYFDFMNERNQEVDYRGIMCKRLILPENFIGLDAGQHIQTSIALSEFYRIEKGGKYFIQYYANNPGYLKLQPSIEMESNTVEIVY